MDVQALAASCSLASCFMTRLHLPRAGHALAGVGVTEPALGHTLHASPHRPSQDVRIVWMYHRCSVTVAPARS